jgi:23S rRNA (uracil1939-C5)-methyltransferase
MRPGERIAVTCADLDDQGACVTAPPRVHVAGALPGERVTATVAHVSRHTSDAWAELEAIETASADRRAPACRAFGACGGCVLQHLAYDAQLDWKRRRVAHALADLPLGKLPGADPSPVPLAVAACVASPRSLGYRNKSKLVAARLDGRLIFGAYAPRSHEVVDLAGCRIAEAPHDDTATALRSLFDQAGVSPYDERTSTGDLRHVVLRSNRYGQVLAVWVVARPLQGGEALARAFRADRPEVLGVVEHQNRARGNAIFAHDSQDDPGDQDRILAGIDAIEDRIDVGEHALRLRLSPRAFFQTNREVAGLAYAAIASGLGINAGDRVVDAYSGVGAIALTLARDAAEVIGIESHAGAVADASASAELNGITNARFVASDAARALATVDRADVVVLNPPRKGCPTAVLAEVARLAPRTIAYLSCDPGTLARDLTWLAARGYQTGSVTPFDMLPHTPHVETLALVARASFSRGIQ